MKLAREGQTRIMLNLAGVQYVSSSLLASLAWLHRRLTTSQAFLKLYGLERILHDSLRICGLDRTFAIYQTELDAFQSAGISREETVELLPDRCRAITARLQQGPDGSP